MSASTVAGQGVGAVIVLAAGAGTRMKSRTSKLLHEVAGRSLLFYAINTAEAVEPERLVVVVGQQRDQVTAHLDEIAPHVTLAVQESPRGTGDAVRCGLVAVPDVQGEIVVTMGDVPMLSGDTLRTLVETHRRHGDAVTVLTTVLDDAGSYGRVVRDDDGQVVAIVEHQDCTPEQLAIGEINAGIYVFQADVLRAGLASLTTDNAQGELYLTDVVTLARGQGGRVHPEVLADRWQAEGINDRTQLAAMTAEVNRRLCARWMLEGVTIVDPSTTWIEESVDLAPDVTLLPGTILQGATTVRSGAIIGPDTTCCDVEVGENATVTRSHLSLAVVGDGAVVGPFAHLRPGTELGASGHLGAFVETKNVILGEGAVMAHLAYRGDTAIAAGEVVPACDGSVGDHPHRPPDADRDAGPVAEGRRPDQREEKGNE